MMTSDLQARARRLLDREPQTDKTAEIRASFLLPLNSRPPLESVATDRLAYAHGTNFAVIVQALRGANGQIVPPARMEELGIVQRTGESSKSAGSPSMAPPFVAVGLLRAGLGMTIGYAQIESGYGPHFWGDPKRSVLSEASDIPAIAIGELLDPEEGAQAMHKELFVDNPIWADDLPEDNMMHGWSRERVGAQMDYMQALGERLNIRVVLTFDPENKGRDQEYRALMSEVIAQISDEQHVDFTDIPVRLVSDVAQEDPQARFEAHETIIRANQIQKLISAR